MDYIVAMTWGSSPLARGLPASYGDVSLRHGIIPARAGFTWECACPVTGRPDHPRSRGVYDVSDMRGKIMWGSSPLARGLRSREPVGWRHPRIIPARAGFTPAIFRSCPRSTDHPRSRGVYPPGPGPSGPRRWDHPRSRGVYWSTGAAPTRTRGSSPLARGLLVDRRRPWGSRRDHPRSRGVYRPLPTPGAPGRDHPRSRGVYNPLPGSEFMSAGSSPLARGLPAAHTVGGMAERIIPARAGFTTTADDAVALTGDHPRSRGVYRPPRRPARPG